MLRNSGNNQVVSTPDQAAQAAASAPVLPHAAANPDSLTDLLAELNEAITLLDTQFGIQAPTTTLASFPKLPTPASLSRSSSVDSLTNLTDLDLSRDAILNRMKTVFTSEADHLTPVILVIDTAEMIDRHNQAENPHLAVERRQPSLDVMDDLPAQHNDCKITLLCILTLVPTILFALNEAAGDALSLYQANNRSITLLATASGITFVASIELSGQSTANNLKEIFSIIANRKRPDDWPPLSKKRIIAVAIIASGFAVWCALSETAQAYDFIVSIGADYKITITPQAVNAWRILAALIASGAAVTTLLTDSYETSNIIYHLAAGNIARPANRISACITPFVASLCVLGAFTNALQTHSSIKDILKLQSTAAIAVLGAACIVNMISTLSFSGGAVINQVDELFAYIPQRKIEPAKIAAFLTSLGLAIFLSYVKRELNLGYYQELANDDLKILPDTTPAYMFETLAWMNFVYEVMLVATSLNPQMIHLFSHVVGKIGALFSCLTQPCRPHPASQEDYPAATIADDAFVDTHYGDDQSSLLRDQGRDIESGARPSQTGLFAPARPAATEELRIPRRERRSSGCPCTIM